jgi:surfeit locus 1 family protein
MSAGIFRFRPYPGLTIATVIAVAILVGLGVWQLQRLQWKLALIATINGHMTAVPLPLDTVLKLPPDQAQYHRVALDGVFLNRAESYVYTTALDGTPVYHVLTPFRTVEGQIVMVDRGAVPLEKISPDTRPAGQIGGETLIIGIWRMPDSPGFFTPKPDLAKHIWYARDLAAMAAAWRVKLSTDGVIEADAAPNTGGLPLGGQTVVDLPNNHLSYAMTWFGLAAGLTGVYLAYHISKGRLGRA